MLNGSRPLYSDAVTDLMTGYVEHTILGSTAGYQTDYQLLIYVYRGYGTSSGNTVYIPPSELQQDYTDLRFVDSQGRLLSFWIETSTSVYATVWVKLNEIPTTGTVIRILYGAGRCITGSNGITTFPTFFDDFLGSSIDATKWSSSGTPTITVSDSVVNVASSSTSYKYLTSTAIQINNSSGLIIESRVKANPVGQNTAASLSYRINGSNLTWELATTNTGSGNYPVLQCYDGSWGAPYAVSGISADTWFRMKLYRPAALNVSINAATEVSCTSHYSTSASTDFEFVVYGTGSISADWIAVRKYAAIEPTHGWWGIAEDF